MSAVYAVSLLIHTVVKLKDLSEISQREFLSEIKVLFQNWNNFD